MISRVGAICFLLCERRWKRIIMSSIKKRFSKDPKVKLVSIGKFLEDSNYLQGIEKKDLWQDKTCPVGGRSYYKVTSNLLIYLYFGITFSWDPDARKKLQKIIVAYRDGKTEYELFDNKLAEIQEERTKHRRSKKLDGMIESLTKARKLLPKYKMAGKTIVKPFDWYLNDTGYKTSKEALMNKYLVFDVETNGIRKSNDDLLSLTIYDPTTGICYNRFFPLELQPLILTGAIHGITEKTLADATHMTQEEYDWLDDYFHFKDRILLSYSGGKGTFDSSFVQNYCKRHNIVGFDDLHFENIKSKIPAAPYECEGQLTKDNLCRIFGIEGVKKIHSSYNDCILEWKLFEKVESECLFFINEHLFKYTPQYIIPYSYLSKRPELIKYANVRLPHMYGKTTEIFRLDFPKKIIREIKKFPTNITGITVEHGINVYLHAEEQNNFEFLAQNKAKLQYVGSLDSKIKEIPIITEDDGTVKAIKPEDRDYIQEVNETTTKIIKHIKPVADYLRANIFKDNKIMTQEIVISEDRKVLTLCDLSDTRNVVEIKTTNYVLDNANNLSESIARQLYFQAKGRDAYVLSIQFETRREKRTFEIVVSDLHIFLYKVELFEYDPASIIRTRTIDQNDIKALGIISSNPCIPKTELAKELDMHPDDVTWMLKRLQLFEYIKKEDSSLRKSPWIVLRNTDDITTKYTVDGSDIHIIK